MASDVVTRRVVRTVRRLASQRLGRRPTSDTPPCEAPGRPTLILVDEEGQLIAEEQERPCVAAPAMLDLCPYYCCVCRETIVNNALCHHYPLRRLLEVDTATCLALESNLGAVFLRVPPVSHTTPFGMQTNEHILNLLVVGCWVMSLVGAKKFPRLGLHDCFHPDRPLARDNHPIALQVAQDFVGIDLTRLASWLVSAYEFLTATYPTDRHVTPTMVLASGDESPMTRFMPALPTGELVSLSWANWIEQLDPQTDPVLLSLTSHLPVREQRRTVRVRKRA